MANSRLLQQVSSDKAESSATAYPLVLVTFIVKVWAAKLINFPD